MTIQFRPLNKIHQFMNEIGYEPGYAYDDLVFSNDAIFIVQFCDDNPERLKLYINKDCIDTEAERIKTQYTARAKAGDYSIEFSGTFSLEQKEDSEEIQINFNKN